jgi:hypothetical protein
MNSLFRRRWATVAGVALVLIAGVGCGDDSSPTAGDTSDTSAPSTSASGAATTTPSVVTTAAPSTNTATGACKYVTTAEASGLATSPVKPGVARSLTSGPVPFEYCDFIFDPGNSPGVTIGVADLQGNGPVFFEQFRQSEMSGSDYQEVSGVGDEAFFAGTNLNVRQGDTGLILYVGRATGNPRGPDAIPDEKALAALILPRL